MAAILEPAFPVMSAIIEVLVMKFRIAKNVKITKHMEMV